MHTEATILQQTQCWLEKVVIGLNFCPFAAKVYRAHQVRYQVRWTTEPEEISSILLQEYTYLDDHPEVATTLLIFPSALTDFFTYLDWLEVAMQQLQETGYEGTYQLASFHPHYCFEGTAFDDPANYTNRSPYPMAHLLREAQIEEVLQHHPHPEQIPEKNIQLAREKGEVYLHTLLQACLREV
ncbi:MAG: DUF1415 domain-containing protein [Thermonemataceae bacterium]